MSKKLRRRDRSRSDDQTPVSNGIGHRNPERSFEVDYIGVAQGRDSSFRFTMALDRQKTFMGTNSFFQQGRKS